MIKKYIYGIVSSLLFFVIVGFSACNFSDKNIEDKTSKEDWDTLQVTVSAFNSVRYQTAGNNPNVAAWGDTLKPGMNAVAISRDLMDLGLGHNDKIKIQGFDSIFTIKDKMHYRWRKRVDIFMGKDIQKAKNFGRKKLEIYYLKKDSTATEAVASE
ncbi:3D domain-containing protein [Zunongwangia sp. SCSIO 43204]|uniref:3D domain-containing protein n=1 Tax=Zunongwangia sp. SCSIO 43204 TaxID=2779359 RepID=UPI001CAA3B88|nr:3D domain-containing protein [Zunongwangia sp. SCSIO 43204]UAB83341.1 3D domain-containing protein [Zunongwangia sp. SCSIO 43204]